MNLSWLMRRIGVAALLGAYTAAMCIMWVVINSMANTWLHDVLTLTTIALCVCAPIALTIAISAILGAAQQPQHSDAVSMAAAIEADRAVGRRVANAYEAERQRIERNLHDGAQQYLVAANMKIGEAQALYDTADNQPVDVDAVHSLLREALDANQRALTALRRTVHEVHPRLLSDHGLAEAVAEVVSTSPVNATLRIPYPLPRLPDGVACAGYFLVCECLTNISKYAPDASCTIVVTAGNDLSISIADTGPGGAVLAPGHGLSGLAARLEAFGGSLSLSSPPGGPTVITGRMPLLLRRGESGIALSDNERESFYEGAARA